MHVYCNDASIVLVGTHKDKVHDPEDHLKISELLVHEFRENQLWWKMIEGAERSADALCFFPIDNTQGQQDPLIGELMCRIEEIAKRSDNLKYKVPFEWLALLDKFEELKESSCLVLRRQKFQEICHQVGFPSSPTLDISREVDLVLRFFNRLGLLMYHVAIPDLVILRPSQFLFPYFTKIICDYELHSKRIPEHREARRTLGNEFKKLEKNGIICPKLFRVLWSSKECRQYQYEIKNLMISLGLIVPIQEARVPDFRKEKRQRTSEGSEDIEFLVPSIVPVQPKFIHNEKALSARAIFAAADCIAEWKKASFINMEDMEKEVRVPAGAFSRLIGSIAGLCQRTEPYPSIYELQISRRSCLFHLGSSSFALTNETTFVGIYIEKGNGHQITEILQWHIKAILEKFLPCFDFLIVVPSGSREQTFAILSGENGIKAREAYGLGIVVSPDDNLSPSDLKSRFCAWLGQVVAGKFIDMFLIILNDLTCSLWLLLKKKSQGFETLLQFWGP